jgi:hypothetical protein
MSAQPRLNAHPAATSLGMIATQEASMNSDEVRRRAGNSFKQEMRWVFAGNNEEYKGKMS